MRTISLFMWIAFVLAIPIQLSSQVLAPSDPTKVEKQAEYFQGDLSAFQVSPSGKGVAYLRYEDEKWVLYWDNINGGREVRISGESEKNVIDFRWVGDDAIVYAIGYDLIGEELHRYETFTKAYNRLTSTPVVIRFLDSHRYSKGTTFLIRDAKGESSTKVYAIMPGARELQHVATGDNVNWIEGLGNGATYYIESVDEGQRFVNCTLNGGEKLGVVKSLAQLKGLALTAKSQAYMLSDIGRNTNALVRMDMALGKEVEVLFEKKDAMISKVLFSHTSAPLMVWYDGITQGFQALDKDFAPVLTGIVEKLPSKVGFDIVHSDQTGNVWIVSIINSDGKRIYYAYNVSNKELKSFGKSAIVAGIEPAIEFVSIENGDRIRLKVYSNKELSSKSIGVLVFRNNPWVYQNDGAIDQLIQRMTQDGFLVAEVDLAYTELSRKKLIYSGYDQLIDRFIDQVPAIHKMMITKYKLPEGVLSAVGEGIGSRAAIRVCAAHTSEVLRSVYIHPAPELNSFLSSEFPVDKSLRSVVLGSFESAQERTIDYIARSPLFVYSESKGEYFESNIYPAIERFSKQSSAPESFLIGAGFGKYASALSLQGIGDRLSEYLRN